MPKISVAKLLFQNLEEFVWLGLPPKHYRLLSAFTKPPLFQRNLWYWIVVANDYQRIFLAVPGGIIVMLNLSVKESTDNDLLKRLIYVPL